MEKEIKAKAKVKAELDHNKMYNIKSTGTALSMPKGVEYEVDGKLAEILINSGKATQI